MDVVQNKTDCTGCHACASVCPKQCIEMKEDHEGFLYPEIDHELCVHCNRCAENCPTISGVRQSAEDIESKVAEAADFNCTDAKEPAVHNDTDQAMPKAYAAYNLNLEVRLQSSSGGVFSLIAEHVLDQGGVVFGAAMTADCMGVEHICITEPSRLGRLRTSKYVQSKIGNAYKEAKEYLLTGKMVLFTGTPCQISGLYAFLGERYDNLITQDIICHGVPSPLVWKKHAGYIERKYKAKLTDVNFRDKIKGWREKYLGLRLSNGETKHIIVDKELFLQGYLADYMLRPSCYACKFKGIQRQADITLADFWGVEHVLPEMDDGKGTSLVLVHSPKGMQLWEEISHKMCTKECDIKAVEKYNPSAVSSVQMPTGRAQVMDNLEQKSVEKLLKKHAGMSPVLKLKRFIVRKIKT